MAYLENDPSVADYALKEKRLVIPFAITGHATPASKSHATDLPAALILSTEGKTATAAAADSGCNFTTESDANGIFGVLIYNLGEVDKLLDVQVVNLSAGTATVSRKGASSTGVTASGNIAVSIDSNQALTSNLSGHVVVDYRLK
jgi:hypothetical protein